MQETTKILCFIASQLNQSNRIGVDTIYDGLVNTKSRVKEIARARQLVGYMLYNHCGMTLKEVAIELNLTNHSTVIYWLDRMESDLKHSKRMQFRYQYLKDYLNGVEREPIKKVDIVDNKNVLSEADKQFINSTIKRGYSYCYYADALRKNRQVVREYIKLFRKNNFIFDAPKVQRFKAKTFTPKIDY